MPARSAEITAYREIQEEMHLATDRLEHVGRFLLTAGGSDELCTLFAGRVRVPAADADGIAGYARHGGGTGGHPRPGLAGRPRHRGGIGRRGPNSVAAIALLWLAARRDWLRSQWTSCMTERLFLDDSQLAEMTAAVLANGPDGIVLDRTVFYARSGGQPGDSGALRWAGRPVVAPMLRAPTKSVR